MENTNSNRKLFFGDKLREYHGDLNEIYNGLSYIEDRLTHVDTVDEASSSGFYVGRTGRHIPMFAIRQDGVVGVGCSYGHAADSLLFQQIMSVPEDVRIAEFVAAHDKHTLYPISDYQYWHRWLTGACYGGCEDFKKKYGFQDDDLASVQRFILLTLKDFSCDTIRKLEPYYFAEGDPHSLEEVTV